MNPAVLTRLDQLEQEWQQRLLMQPSSGQVDKKRRGVGDPSSSPSVSTRRSWRDDPAAASVVMCRCNRLNVLYGTQDLPRPASGSNWPVHTSSSGDPYQRAFRCRSAIRFPSITPSGLTCLPVLVYLSI